MEPLAATWRMTSYSIAAAVRLATTLRWDLRLGMVTTPGLAWPSLECGAATIPLAGTTGVLHVAVAS
jgi:hypothetical protein